MNFFSQIVLGSDDIKKTLTKEISKVYNNVHTFGVSFRMFKYVFIFFFILILQGCTFVEQFIQPHESVEESILVSNFDIDQNDSNLNHIDPIVGGTLHISMRNPTTLNPLINTDPIVSAVLSLIYEPLFIFNGLTPQAVLAHDIQVNEGLQTTATITLANRNFSDGTQLTSQDVLFSINTIRQNPTSPYYTQISRIINATAIDSLTVQITFNGPIGGRVKQNLMFPIIPNHFFLGQLNERNLQVLGTGPFTIQSITLPREIILTQNPQSNTNPYISAVRVLITQDRATDFNSFSQNITNVVFGGSMSELPYYGISPVGINITSYPTNNFDFIAFNFDNIIFNSTIVRQAIAYAMLNEYAIYTAYLGQVARTSSVVHPQSEIYKNDLNYYPQDIERAQYLFYQAGFSDIGYNTLGSIVSGVPVPLSSLRILVNNENLERLYIANLLRQNLESIGIDINFMSLDFYEYKEEIRNRNFDILFAGIKLNYDLRPLLSSDGAHNFMNYTSTTLDEYLAQSVNAITSEDYKEIMFNIQSYINENLPIIGIAFKDGVVLTNSGVYVQGTSSINSVFKGIDSWFLY